MADPIVVASDLAKSFRVPVRRPGRFGILRGLVRGDSDVRHAVSGVSFELDQGEAVGYVGPNGAGKSTTIKMLTGILQPTAGDARVVGIVPWREREKNAFNIGVVFGQRSQLWWDLPLAESFELVRRMYRIDSDRYKRNLDRFRSLLDLDDFIDSPVRQLSLGQRMRGELTAALLHDPRVVYLDEPTVGLDVVARERIRTFIAEINRENGTTILLTTHDLADIERLCSRIILIDHGRIAFDGPVDRFKSDHAPYRELVVHLASLGDQSGSPRDVAGLSLIAEEPGLLRYRFDPATTPVHVAVGVVAAQFAVADLSIVEPDLESIVRDIYEHRQSGLT